MTIDINWPAGEIQNGQYCQAYALAYDYTGSLTFDWGLTEGQFDNSYAFSGPLGARQIVGGFTSSSRDNWLELRVIDSSSPPDTLWDYTPTWTWGDFNDECEV